MEESKFIFLLESGDLFLRDGQSREAISCYNKMLSTKPSGDALYRTLNNLAVAHKRLGEYNQSIAVLGKAISINPNYRSFYSNAAQVLKLQGEMTKAAQCLQKSIQIEETLVDYISLIELLKDMKRYDDALKVANIMLLKYSNEYDAFLSVGNLLSNTKSFSKAIDYYQKAIQIDPNKTQAYNNIGVAYKETMQEAKALTAYQKALELNPNDAAAHNNIGNLLRNMNEFDSAIEHLKKSITINPSYADAYSNLGAVYKEAKEYEKAYGYYEQAIKLNPKHTNANFDMALIELSRGEYESAWPKYEHRLKMNELLSKTYKYKTPMWRGEALEGKTIILQNEQGYGDNIMFIRYVPKFLELGAKVIIRTRPELVRLFESIKGVSLVCSEEEEGIPEHDYYLPIMSSALMFKTTLKTIPSNFPYLRSLGKNGDIGLDNQKTNIGLVWSSSRTNKDFKNKYIGVDSYAELLDISSANYFSLQVGEDAIKADSNFATKLIDLSKILTDFSATASVIDALDIVITTDTSVAHLCGAIGKKAYVLVPTPADWRWMQDGESTPWYPSLKIFRQTKRGSWREPIRAIKEQLLQKLSVPT